MRKTIVGVLAFLAVAAVVGFIATSGARFPAAQLGVGGGDAAGGSSAADGAVTDSAVLEEAAPAEGEPGGSLRGVGELPLIGPSVVKTARLSLVVDEDGFAQAFSAVSSIAGRSGGYVESSSRGGTRSRFGELLIRVPSSSFDEAMADLTELGRVDGQEFSARDVSTEFVDLEARLRTWVVQEGVLLDLMRQANTVQATLQIQRELQDVQFRIEQIKGNLRLLENQTQYSTIYVSLRTPGTPIQLEQRRPDERPSLGEAWSKALNGFLGVLYATVVGLGYLIPIAALGALAWFGFRRVRPATS